MKIGDCLNCGKAFTDLQESYHKREGRPGLELCTRCWLTWKNEIAVGVDTCSVCALPGTHVDEEGLCIYCSIEDDGSHW